MDSRTFYTRLTLVTALTAALLAVLHFAVPAARLHGALPVACMALFIAICIGLFYMGRSAAQSRNKLAFNNVISLSVFGKMLASIAFLLIYQKTARPANEWFVAIFLLTYLTYTVFEVWFMTRLAKS